MSKALKLADLTEEGLTHIKDIRLSDGGYLYLTDYFVVGDKRNMDMVILNPEEIRQLKDFLNEKPSPKKLGIK